MRAIDSALNQTYSNCEVVMVDDGSDQETREIYRSYGDRIKLIQLERSDVFLRTPSRARNAGIEASNGEYICFLDSDNYYASTFVEKLIALNADVAYCNWEIIGLQQYKVEVQNKWNPDDTLLKNYLMMQHLDHQCLLIKRSYLGEERYDTRLPRSQDCDLMVRLIIKNGEWKHCRDNLFFFEKHEQDQLKSIASVHGKTLWTLKNNINIQWLLGWLQKDPRFMVAYVRAVNDFMTLPEWKETYDNSEYKKLRESTLSELGLEKSER